MERSAWIMSMDVKNSKEKWVQKKKKGQGLLSLLFAKCKT
jgi:hypothetical protein